MMTVFFRNAIETLKDSVKILFAYSFPIIGILEVSDAFRYRTLDTDGNAWTGITERIFNQIPEDGIDERLVPFDAQFIRDRGR